MADSIRDTWGRLVSSGLFHHITVVESGITLEKQVAKVVMACNKSGRHLQGTTKNIPRNILSYSKWTSSNHEIILKAEVILRSQICAEVLCAAGPVFFAYYMSQTSKEYHYGS